MACVSIKYGKDTKTFTRKKINTEICVEDRFQTKTQLMIAKINKTFDTAIRNRFFFLVCG